MVVMDIVGHDKDGSQSDHGSHDNDGSHSDHGCHGDGGSHSDHGSHDKYSYKSHDNDDIMMINVTFLL